MPRKPIKKATIVRHKKNRKGAVVEPEIKHGVPLFEALPMTRILVDPPKPKPVTVADAWDAMKEAGELPYYQRHAVNPYREAQNRADEVAKTASQRVRTEFADGLVYDSARHSVPNVHQSSEPIIPLLPLWKNDCPHVFPNGSSCIDWMEHSQHIITGVCAHCPMQFDTRHPEHKMLFLAAPKAARNMGHAGQYNKPGTSVGEVYGTPWQIFVYNHFAWMYSVKVWLRNSPALLRKAWKWINTDF
jgi:hypothetical protein